MNQSIKFEFAARASCDLHNRENFPNSKKGKEALDAYIEEHWIDYLKTMEANYTEFMERQKVKI